MQPGAWQGQLKNVQTPRGRFFNNEYGNDNDDEIAVTEWWWRDIVSLNRNSSTMPFNENDIDMTTTTTTITPTARASLVSHTFGKDSEITKNVEWVLPNLNCQFKLLNR